MTTGKSTSMVAYAAAIALGVAGLALAVRSFGHDEAAWCRRVFSALAQGKPYIQEDIDWEVFTALDSDVGATYRQLPNDDEKASFRQMFINRFGEGFRQSKARLSDFTNWRLQERQDEGRLVVASDHASKNKTVLFTISQVGQKRLERIQWQ